MYDLDVANLRDFVASRSKRAVLEKQGGQSASSTFFSGTENFECSKVHTLVSVKACDQARFYEHGSKPETISKAGMIFAKNWTFAQEPGCTC
jgi:hypothetical protein